MLAEAEGYLGSRGVRDRVDLVEGNIFERVDATADLYLLKDVIHDWDDERSARSSRPCARRWRRARKLVLVETLQERNVPHPAASLADVQMLTQCDGGRQRSVPDPALSTGYGRAFVRRGWGRWGAEPYTDVLALTDAAERRPEIDAGRTAAMGGSFGGYLANWVAGHTDRFAAVVTHASLWALDQFVATTDTPGYWRRELTPQVAAEYSPHRFAGAISTPMLVIHGDRGPPGAGRRGAAAVVGPAEPRPRPDAPQVPLLPRREPLDPAPSHARLWYATVLAFLDQHVRGAEWRVPDLLP